MQKRYARWFTLFLSLLLPLIAACGTNTLTNSNTSLHKVPTVPPGENIYVLDGYNSSGNASPAQHIIALHPEQNTLSKNHMLPAGLTSLDHQLVYTATSQNGHTTIAVINTQTGATIRSFVIAGTYTIDTQGYDTATLSGNGQWLALREIRSQSNTTTIALVDTQSGKLTDTIHLNGDFSLDAISPDGKSIYFLEKLNDSSGHYQVRLYQVDAHQLADGYIVDKTIPNDIMSGTALTRQMSSDGVIAYTLYIDTVHNIAFVHILPLGTDFYGARCIDLPVGKAADALHYYMLALSPDGNTLYAANGALGVVSAISLEGLHVFDDKITTTGHFNSGTGSMTSGDKTRMLHNGAALSSDGNMLYFTGMHGIWAINTPELHAGHSSFVKASYLQQQTLTGIALSANNKTLYAVDPAHGILSLDVITGTTQQLNSDALQNPWGIEWISNGLK
ncbi:MAG: hypothetical protein M3Z24_04220 [Chloroflexota bacterium]|nr:hypothetical protein [Chloroflexota bacterium]